MPGYVRRPPWLKLKPLDGRDTNSTTGLMRKLNLHTVCEGARCPNRGDCFGHATATFLILGDTCTRNCTFCAVNHGKPQPVDLDEPQHIVEAVKKLGLKYVVVTSVTRDDLPDDGADHFAKVIEALRYYNTEIVAEVLIPDFKGSTEALRRVVMAKPDVLNHNIETAARLYPEVRPQANYQRSLELLSQVKEIDSGMLTKSGFMLGLGETKEEVVELLSDLRTSGCDIVTIGQYLQPSYKHHEIVRYVSPNEFNEYTQIGEEMGFAAVVSAPLVRSSFRAAETYQKAKASGESGRSAGI
jgi:lipoyl synthase